MVDATNSPFDKTPEALHAIGVDIPHHVDFRGVPDAAVLVASGLAVRVLHVRNAIVARPLVGIDGGVGKYVLRDQRQQGGALGVLGRSCYDAPFALDNSDDGCFLLVSAQRTSACALAAATKIGLVHFDGAAKRFRVILIEQRADFVEHSPRGLVGYASLPLNLFRGDPATRGRHQVDGVEPGCKRSTGFVEDRVGCRVNMVSAMITRVRSAAGNAVMLCRTLARFAENSFWVQIVEQPLKAGVVIWKHFVEVVESKVDHPRFGLFHTYHLGIE